MQRKTLSTNSEDEEEIQMDDKLTEEVESIGKSNEATTQVYQKNGFSKNQSPTQLQGQKKQKEPLVMDLQIQQDNGRQVQDNSKAPNQDQNQAAQHESVTLKDKLLNIFTNVNTKNTPPKNVNQSKSYALQLEENFVENRNKKGEIHHFKIDHEMDIFEDDTNDKENQQNGEEEQKKNGIQLFEHEEVDNHLEIEIGSNNRKTSEDYIQLPDSKQQNFDLLGRQLTEYELQMKKVQEDQKKQEVGYKQIQQLLSQYDNVKIVKIENFRQSGMKEVHDLNINIQKGSTLSFDENQLFKGSKIPVKNKGFFDFITNKTTRYALLHNENLVFCERIKKNEFKVHSINPLQNLFQIYNNKNSTQIRMYFINKQRNQYSLPINKMYNIDRKEQFLIQLRKALNKIGLDYKLS
ncbi:hypothetical protein ABPG72_013172 [Tetrahymena utriculariae]